MSRKVDFFIAGVQKGGTSALWHYLRQHSKIGMSDPKELHFFDNESIDWSEPPFEILESGFPNRIEVEVLGEATPIYLYWPNSLERIVSYNPKAKIIVSFREPAIRAFSHWRMETARGAETLSFSEAIRSGRDRVCSDPSAPGFHRVFSYVERGLYASQIRRLYNLFPKDQILLIRQIDLRDNFQSVMQKIYDFLEVSREKINQDDSLIFSFADKEEKILNSDLEFLESIYATELSDFKTLTGIDLTERP